MSEQNNLSRTKRSANNIVFAMINFVVKSTLSFIVRTIFIRYLSIEYLGLNSLFANILQIFSLAELGIGSAIIYSMYKPVAENDVEKIKSLCSFYKAVYWIISLIILVAGMICLPFLHYFISGEPNLNINIRIIFIIFLVNMLASYLLAHRRTIIFAYQRNDIETKVQSLVSITLSLFQIVCLIIFKNYYLYVVLIVIATFIDGLIIFYISYKLFPQINGKSNKLEKAEIQVITKNTSAIFVHRIGGVLVYSIDNIVISVILGLFVLGQYSNYFLIISTINGVIGIFTNACSSSVGNLIAASSKDNSMQNFRKLNLMLFCIVGFCSICLLVLFQHFITLWIGEENLLEMQVVVFLVASFYITGVRRIVEVFKNCAGLFKQNVWMPFVEGAIKLGASILLVNHIGVGGAILATIISTILMPFWVDPFILYRYYFKESVLKYFAQIFIYSLITLGIGVGIFYVCSLLPDIGLAWFLFKMGVCSIIIPILYLLIYFRTKECRLLWADFKRVISKNAN